MNVDNGFVRMLRAIGAVAPAFLGLIPPPYSLIVIPILGGIGKGVRDYANPGHQIANHWSDFIPF